MEIPCCGFTCPVEATLRLVGGKYKAVILWHLMDAGTLRYHELHRRFLFTILKKGPPPPEVPAAEGPFRARSDYAISPARERSM